MFDIGFGEIILISVIALLVAGPERLPGMLRTLGVWFSRVRRMVNSVKNEFEREIAAEELKQSLAESKALIEELKKKAVSATSFDDGIDGGQQQERVAQQQANPTEVVASSELPPAKPEKELLEVKSDG